MAEKIEEKSVYPVFKLLGVHMIVCFRPFFLRLLKGKKKQKHLEFNVKVARAKREHLFYICTVTTLPSPTHFEPPLHWYEGVFHSIREVTLLFCNFCKCPQRPLNNAVKTPVFGNLFTLLNFPSHSHGQFAVGHNEKNKTIVIFVFIFTPKW